MKKHILAYFAPVLLACNLSASAAFAQNTISGTVSDLGLGATVTHLQDTQSENTFALGFIQTLHAVENSLQDRWKYGLGSSMVNFPLMRIKISSSPTPTQAGPDTISNIMRDFLADISFAKSNLHLAATDPTAQFTLRIGDLWFDVNNDGLRDDTESAEALIGGLILSSRQLRAAKKNNPDQSISDIIITFDQADVQWLLAYTEILSSVAEVFLSFDPTPIFTHLATQTALLDNVPTKTPLITAEYVLKRSSKIKAEIKILRTQLEKNKAREAALAKAFSDLSSKHKNFPKDTSPEDYNALVGGIITTRSNVVKSAENSRQTTDAIQKLKSELDDLYATYYDQEKTRKSITDNSYKSFVDPFYIMIESLRQQPDPKRMKAAHTNLTKMVEYNKVFWAEVAKETDNKNEWIPNPQQTSALGIDIPDDAGVLWQAILNDAELVLKGDLLIPHPFLPSGYGISLKSYIQNPSPIDIVGMIHGVSMYPFVEIGPRVSNRNWRTFRRLLQGRASAFALFFN